MFQLTHLANGLRVVTSQLPYARSISLSIFIGSGSRYERDEEAGAAHFAEHLLFKGTQKRPSPKELSEAIEGVGGLLNGGTDKELSVFWCKVARPHFPLAVEVLSDMLLHSRFDPQEIEKERRVIGEEINMSLDTPIERVHMLLEELLWPGHPLGRDVAGTRETVSRLSREELLDFTTRHYLPGNAVVSVAGDLEDAQELKARLEEAFASWKEGPLPVFPPWTQSQIAPRVKVEYRETEQVQLCLALPGLPYLHPQRLALALLNVVLGEGMSSRLFQEIRERRGLAYDIQSYVGHLRDTGSLVVSAGVDPQHYLQALEAIIEELERLKLPVPEAELAKAREFYKGRLLLRLEDSRAVAGWLGTQELLTQKVLIVEEVLAQVDHLTTSDLEKVAGELISPARLNLALVGPVRDEATLEAKLKI